MQGYDNERKIATAVRLRQLRKDKGLSIKKLAEVLSDTYKIDISESSLKNYELEDASKHRFDKGFGMKIVYLYALAAYFDVSTDYLLGITPSPTRNLKKRAACEHTGLEEPAIDAVNSIKGNSVSFKKHKKDYELQHIDVLNTLCIEGFIESTVKAFGRFICDVNESTDIKHWYDDKMGRISEAVTPEMWHRIHREIDKAIYDVAIPLLRKHYKELTRKELRSLLGYGDLL